MLLNLAGMLTRLPAAMKHLRRQRCFAILPINGINEL
jgi:hypothetical protein